MKRSPVLGYNHNVRYAGRLWHVQTEDSGVSNPHVFTHLFHEGTILATKRMDYDPTLEMTAVQKLMQSQHKAMLRELKAGTFDEKIGKFFGHPVERDVEETTDPGAQGPAIEMEADAADEETMSGDLLSPFAESAVPDVAPPVVAAAAKPPPPPKTHDTDPSAPPVTAEPPRIAPSRTNVPVPSRTPTPRPGMPAARPGSAAAVPRVGGIGSRRAPTPAGGVPTRPTAEGVVVARPAVIIGGDSSARRETTAPRGSSQPIQTKRWHAPAPEPPKPPPPSDNIFGGDLISEKSLDEVILAYLSEDMNEK
jgi:hypothetical protein